MPREPSLWSLWVVILNWNLPDDTLACVASVLAAADRVVAATGDRGAVQTLIVDNGSRDDSGARFAQAQQDPTWAGRVHVIETGRNLGFAGGVNVGMRHALAQGAAGIFLLNNDTLIAPDLLTQLAAQLTARPEVGLVGPVIHYADPPTRIWRFADNEHPWLPLPRRVPDAAVSDPQTPPFVTDYITGCALWVRAEVVQTIGLLDAAYFMYFEDADYCRRARDAGYTILCVPQARMWHKVSVSANKEKAANRYARAWGRVRFYRTHPHGRLPWLVHGYIWTRAVAQTIADLLRGQTALIEPLWRGTLDGYRASLARQETPHLPH